MRNRKPLAIAIASASALMLALSGTASAATKTVHMRGTAYEFNSVHTMLTGAVIKVEEYKTAKAIVGTDGKYDLVVPANAKAVTPYIAINGYYGIHLQTFTTKTSDFKNVNFQVPTNGVGEFMMMILNVTPLNSLIHPWRVKDCAIVSTFSTKNVHNLDYNGFIGYGAHGVAGATASATPSLTGVKAPVYFNENVTPDRTVKSSSIDGGVIFTRVPSGVYTIKASHKKAKFATFKATCKPGWVVNANPPWGLYQTS